MNAYNIHTCITYNITLYSRWLYTQYCTQGLLFKPFQKPKAAVFCWIIPTFLQPSLVSLNTHLSLSCLKLCSQLLSKTKHPTTTHYHASSTRWFQTHWREHKDFGSRPHQPSRSSLRSSWCFAATFHKKSRTAAANLSLAQPQTYIGRGSLEWEGGTSLSRSTRYLDCSGPGRYPEGTVLKVKVIQRKRFRKYRLCAFTREIQSIPFTNLT